MPKIRLEVFEKGEPSATITVPSWLVAGASKLLPKIAGKAMQEHVDLNQIAEMIKQPGASGILLEINDHKGGDRVVISIVGEPAQLGRS